jgi:PGF-pre-PGF domain-containing protein
LLEIGNNSEFNSSALDDDLDTLIYTWNFSDSTDLVVSQNTTHQFNSTGDFVIIINVSDTYANNQTNITITVNDTLPPLTDSITYLTEHHLSRDGANYSINTTLFDYSGVFSSTLEYNNTTQTSSCNDENVSWNCSWTIENLTVATYSFTLNATDNFTTQHRNSTDYSFNVVSCSDETENGDETGVDCGGSCDACAGTSGSSSSSSSSSGGGGSGGGSGGGTTAAVVTPDSPTKNPVSSEKAVESSGAAAAVVVNSASEAPTIFNQDISFSKDKYTQIKFEDETLSVKELEIKSGVDKVTVLKVDYFEEKPSEVFSLLGAYQYFEITVDLSADEIDHATLKFEVPKSWFEEHSYLPESVKLNTFEDEKWIELKTDFVDESEYFFSYQAELKHFSFFAINARKSSGNLFGGVVAFFKNIPELLSVRVLVLFSFIVLILVLAVIYFKIREKDY